MPGEPSGRLHEGGIGRLTQVRSHELAIGTGKILGGDDCVGTAPEQLRPAGPETRCQRVELSDELIVELHQDFSSSHHHMVEHMVEHMVMSKHQTFGGAGWVGHRPEA